LGDLEIPKDSGQIILFRHFDFINKEQARIILEIFSINARSQMLFGNKLIILVQVDNPNFKLNSTGETFVHWNGSEWLNSNRN
jgi:glycosyltransferase involved in cell wall biosynthesis